MIKVIQLLPFLTIATCLTVLCGCGRSEIDRALDSDANGYRCTRCQTKFYTSRSDFAQVCPECKRPDIEEVIGYVCPADNHVTLGPRSRGVLRCDQCGGAASGRSIPQESDLKAWGAAKRGINEVSRGT